MNLEQWLAKVSAEYRHPSRYYKYQYKASDVMKNEEGYYVWVEDEDGMKTSHYLPLGVQLDYLGQSLREDITSGRMFGIK